MQQLADAIADDLADARPRPRRRRTQANADRLRRSERAGGCIDEVDGLREQLGGTPVAITEPVPGYLIDALGLSNLTPPAFSEAIEEGEDVSVGVLDETLRLFTDDQVEALIYNEQTTGPDHRPGRAARPRTPASRSCAVDRDAARGRGLRQLDVGQRRRHRHRAGAADDGGRAVSASSLRDASLAYGERSALGRPRPRRRARPVPRRARPQRQRQVQPAQGAARAHAADRRHRARSPEPRCARAIPASATSRSSAASTPTCRCAHATWSGSASTGTAGASAWPNRSRRARVDELLGQVQATSYADVPLGQLSGGEQQRLRVAQALATDPAVLLCDEPLLSLDLNHQQMVVDLIDRRRREHDTAVLFVTHEINPILPYRRPGALHPRRPVPARHPRRGDDV